MSPHTKVVIVTGASRGIGLAAAKFLIKEQHRVVLVSRTTSVLNSLQVEHPDQVRILAGDLADLSIAKKAIDLALSTWSRIDGLIINHGVLDPVKRLADVSIDEMKHSFDVNVFSAVALVKESLPALRETKGRIIMTSSGAAVSAYAAWGTYGASKAVLNHLAQTLAVEEPNITSMAIRPGVVDTDMQRDLREVHASALDKSVADKFQSLKTDGGLLKPEQPGHVIARLALNAASELSGRFVNWNDPVLSEWQDV